MGLKSSALTRFLRVAPIPCGAPGITCRSAPWDEFGRKKGRRTDGHDQVVVAMENERGYVEPTKVGGEVRLGRVLDAIEDRIVPLHHPLAPEGVAQPCETLAPGRLAP